MIKIKLVFESGQWAIVEVKSEPALNQPFKPGNIVKTKVEDVDHLLTGEFVAIAKLTDARWDGKPIKAYSARLSP